MPDKISTIIVDDEPLAQKGLKNYLDKVDYLALAGICENAYEAMEMLSKQPIDLMLLDIQMPGITGIQLLKSLDKKPLTIIISAYPDHALESYELDVIDYLIKPVSFERFTRAVRKAREFYNFRKGDCDNDALTYMFVKCIKNIEKVYIDDILYIESLHNYIAINTTNKKFISYQTLKNFQLLLPPNRFVKIQKSFIVAIDKIDAIENGKVNINGKLISISRSMKAGLHGLHKVANRGN